MYTVSFRNDDYSFPVVQETDRSAAVRIAETLAQTVAEQGQGQPKVCQFSDANIGGFEVIPTVIPPMEVQPIAAFDITPNPFIA
jgi:hypothetical protein